MLFPLGLVQEQHQEERHSKVHPFLELILWGRMDLSAVCALAQIIPSHSVRKMAYLSQMKHAASSRSCANAKASYNS